MGISHTVERLPPVLDRYLCARWKGAPNNTPLWPVLFVLLQECAVFLLSPLRGHKGWSQISAPAVATLARVSPRHEISYFRPVVLANLIDNLTEFLVLCLRECVAVSSALGWSRIPLHVKGQFWRVSSKAH